ncbi:putative pentatricopeptide repeat-containing protein At1g12700, mitochondrial [Salvia hispanica]|uniref:putative pentatricopeptide repeat-containing protein At1g12700, mitochondrial n=1 Tax=Salvia hispanica TaxID=49212 RepID=UPI002008FAEE|nr:putative pentatricopeptide repeat-containing protein At1g12700, mitochondrial [Salvia hispanica]
MSLILRRIAARFGTVPHSISLCCSNSRYECRKPFSSMLRIDFSSINDIQFANFLFREMSRIRPQPSISVYNKLLTTVVVNMEHHSVALSMFDEMRQSGLPVNEYTFSIIMHCYCLLNRVDLGFSILGSFFKLGYEPDAAIFTTLIKGLFLDHKAIEAEKLFNKLLDDNKIFEPCQVTFFVHGLCKAGHTVTACNYIDLLAEKGCIVRYYAYNALVDSLCRGGMVEDAILVLRRMIDRGVMPSTVTYTSIVHAMCWVGRWEDVRVLLREMFDKKVFINVITFTALVNMLCKNGRVEEAEDLVEIMVQQNVSPDVYTYNALIDGYCSHGKMDKARELIDSLAEKGIKPNNVFSYGSLINGYCKNGNLDEAKRDSLDVPGKGPQNTSGHYSSMIKELLCEDRFSDGWKLFSDMEAQGVHPDIFTCSILLAGLCKAHRIDDAISLVRAMEERGDTPNIITYDILICGLCKEGRQDLARGIFNELPSKDSPETIRMAWLTNNAKAYNHKIKH